MNLQESIEFTNGWYYQHHVQRMILEYMGVPEYHGVSVDNDFCRSKKLYRYLDMMSNEYTVFRGIQIQEEKGGVARSVKNFEIPFYLNFKDPVLEIQQSFWQRDIFHDATQHPERIIGYCDIEFYNKHAPGEIVVNQVECFKALEPCYQLIKYWFSKFGVRNIAVKTGKGYNFIFAVSFGTPAYFHLCQIGKRVEPSVRYRQNFPYDGKRDRVVPLEMEAGFRGSFRVMQYFMNTVMKQAEKISELPVTISDDGDIGISFDPTQLLRPVQTACFGVPGSPYLNFLLQAEKIGQHIIQETPIPIRLIRSRDSNDYFEGVEELIYYSNHYHDALKLISVQDGHIPDASEGVMQILDFYKMSELAWLHERLDSEDFDPIERWDQTYRNFTVIQRNHPSIASLIDCPNPRLLQPAHIKNFIVELYTCGWSPKHIAGLLTAIYTGPHFGYGSYFGKHDPARHAIGWVTIKLGEFCD